MALSIIQGETTKGATGRQSSSTGPHGPCHERVSHQRLFIMRRLSDMFVNQGDKQRRGEVDQPKEGAEHACSSR